MILENALVPDVGHGVKERRMLLDDYLPEFVDHPLERSLARI
jgi:hypothetical protein